MKLAVIGTGISGLAAGTLLARRHDVTFFEKDDRAGGHSHTVLVPHEGVDIPVDTGFIVYNERTYPRLTALFKSLGVATQDSDMSFSVRCESCDLEYASHLPGLFADPRNAVRPAHHRMIKEMFRFFREAPAVLDDPTLDRTALGEWLEAHDYADVFRRHFILPLGGAVWSTSLDGMNAFPVRYFVRFFANHGFLGVNTSPQWKTVTGGSRAYVQRMTAGLEDRIRLGTPVAAVERIREGAGVLVRLADGSGHRFDAAILASHADQSLRLLGDASPEEARALGGIPYTRNETVLHTDTSLLPKRSRARASWNVHLEDCGAERPVITMTYDLTRLQSLPGSERYLVTLNDTARIDSARVIRRMRYEHPHYTVDGLERRKGLARVNGADRVWFCGAWCGFGFHEDGLAAGMEVAERLEREAEATGDGIGLAASANPDRTDVAGPGTPESGASTRDGAVAAAETTR